MNRRTLLQSLAFPALSPDTAPLSIVEAGTGKAISARVLARSSSQHDYVPAGSVEVPVGPDRWFVADSPVRLPAGSGAFSIRIEHGLEHRPVKTASRRVELARWIDMQARGYSSGDNHLHVEAAPLSKMMAAEALDFGASLQWWNGPKWDVPAHPQHTHISQRDAEVETDWGAVYLIGLRKPLAIPADPRRSNLPFVREARRQGAFVCYQGGWSREVLLDSLLGYVDAVNICNNNFQRYRFQPRAKDSNLLGVSGLGEYPNTDEGMMHLSMDSYYRLLNCGLRLAAGAESAAGVKSNPCGYNRAYVRAGARPSLNSFYNAWRQGKSFVTNGPMIFLEVNTTYRPGDTLRVEAGKEEIEVRATALCDQPIDRLEVVVNGRVIAAGTGSIHHRVRLSESSWIAARATATDRFLTDEELSAYRGESAHGGQRPSRLRFGHTSPIYVAAGGVPVRVAQSVGEARKMLDALEKWAQTAPPQWRDEVMAALPPARQKLA